MGAAASLSSDDFAKAIANLLPSGLAWNRDPDSNMQAFIHGVADGLAIIHARAGQLSEVESDPRLTSSMLSDWERAWGLPDTCITGFQSVSQRRTTLVSKIASLGGQSRQYFIGVAASLGFAITITEFHVFKAGHSVVGDAVPVDGFLNTWLVTASASVNVIYFTADHSSAGDPLAFIPQTLLQCVLTELAPAHTQVLFSFI